MNHIIEKDKGGGYLNVVDLTEGLEGEAEALLGRGGRQLTDPQGGTGH